MNPPASSNPGQAADSQGGPNARLASADTPLEPTAVLRELRVPAADELVARLAAEPPHRELFVSRNVAFAFAVFELLDESERQPFVALVREYASGLMAAGPGEDEGLSACSRALWQAKELDGGAPVSEDRFMHLRDENRHLRWPAGSTIRAHLGGDWNYCLRWAHLPTVPEGDALTPARGLRYSDHEVFAAVRLWVEQERPVELTRAAYLNWAHRRDVRALPGRRPLSPKAFRHWPGGFEQVLLEAGAVDEATLTAKRDTAARRALGPSRPYTDAEILGCVRRVARIYKRAPSQDEYRLKRDDLVERARERGEPIAMPTISTIWERFGDWEPTLIAAGLDPSEVPPQRRRGADYSDEELIAFVREAYLALGRPDPYRRLAYIDWRRKQEADEKRAGVWRRIPSGDTMTERFGSWRRAVELALADLPPGGQEQT